MKRLSFRLRVKKNKNARQISLFFCLLIAGSDCFGAEGGADGIYPIKPAELDFFDKKAEYQGIPIKANRCVNDRALLVARQKLDSMLKNAPDIVFNLKQSGCELHIIGAKQLSSDLPELRCWKGKPFEGTMSIDERTRGVGGRFASCGEENLLHLEGDRYFDRDICVHEFAHTILEFGLDAALRKRVKAQYQNSKNAQLWNGCYALNNEGEFWAELSMWYFGSRGDFGKISLSPKVGKDWFAHYDAAAYTLLDDIYCGRLTPRRVISEILKPVDASLESRLKSENALKPVKIRFVNLTDKKLKLFWLDYEGKRKLYGEVLPLGEIEQSTFATHPWLVTDSGGNGIAIYRASSENGVAHIAESKQ